MERLIDILGESDILERYTYTVPGTQTQYTRHRLTPLGEKLFHKATKNHALCGGTIYSNYVYDLLFSDGLIRFNVIDDGEPSNPLEYEVTIIRESPESVSKKSVLEKILNIKL